MYCEEIKYSLHAEVQMATRDIEKSDVKKVIRYGETIMDYPDIKPYPGRLILLFIESRPLHVVVSRDDFTEICHVITAYEPDLERWHLDFKTRKK